MMILDNHILRAIPFLAKQLAIFTQNGEREAKLKNLPVPPLRIGLKYWLIKIEKI
ncbi:MAG: hypothetical protein AAGD05_11620 [Bacteroidota bacterium]